MTVETLPAEATSLVLRLGPWSEKMSDEEFFALCQWNQGLCIERTSDGELIAMTPAGGESANIEYRLTVLFGIWAESNGSGIGFSSSGGFRLPSGATRSPDLAWVKRARWEQLAPLERKRFPPLCPDFVAEIRSENDSLRDLLAKMLEYLDNGALLGWLLDPLEKKVYVYRPGMEPECLDNPAAVSGDPVLPGFTLDLRRLWG